MRLRWRVLKSPLCKLLVVCLLMSLFLVNVPTEVQADPGLLTITMIVWETVKMVLWPPGTPERPFEAPKWLPGNEYINRIIDWVLQKMPRPDESLFATPAKASTMEELESQFETEIRNATAADLEDVRRELWELRTLLSDEIASRPETGIDDQQNKRLQRLEVAIASFEANTDQEIDRRVSSLEVAVEEYAEKLHKLESRVGEVIPEALAAVKQELETHSHPSMSVDAEEIDLIEELNELRKALADLRITIERETKRREETDIEQREDISFLEGLIADIAGQTKDGVSSADSMPKSGKSTVKRKFGVGAGGYFSESADNTVMVYEGEFTAGSLGLFGGAGDSGIFWIRYLGLRWRLTDLVSLGIGGVDSSDLEQAEIMYDVGISLGSDRLRLNVDYFYVPEAENAGGTRAGLQIRF